jgi:hypothetical protein
MTTEAEEIEERGQIVAVLCDCVRSLVAVGIRIEAQRDGAIRDWKGYAQQCHEARAELATVKAELAKALSVLQDAGPEARMAIVGATAPR